MRRNKRLNVFLVFVMLFSILPPSLFFSGNADAAGGPVDVWPEFTAYTFSDGHPILDPGADVNPIDVDITSGVDRGIGNLPSMYVASDETNFFVRLRLKGNPYDRKGGFLSSVWLVKLASGGEHKATIGVNGKSPHVDYVYVADANGTNVERIYETETPGGNSVPGTTIVPAENGHYFLDFQVPIERITGVAPEITADTPVQLFFGTSKAANLSVINKEWMDTVSSDGKETNFSGLKEIKLNNPILSPSIPSEIPIVTIDGGDSEEYGSNDITVTGSSSLTSGKVFFELNGSAITDEALITDGTWELALPGIIPDQNGSYLLTAKVIENGMTASTSKEIVIIKAGTDLITINGGAVAVADSLPHAISGTFAGQNPQNYRIRVFKGETELTDAASDGDGVNWSYALESLDEGPNLITVKWTSTGNNYNVHASVTQQLTYIPTDSTMSTPLTVSIDSITGDDAKPGITGTASGAELVEVQIGGNTVEIATPINGVWTVAPLERPLPAGTHNIVAIAKNSDGEIVMASTTHEVATTSITIDNGASVILNDNTPTIRGNTNAVDGSQVEVSIGSAGPYFTTAQSGRWTIETPLDSPIADGTHTVTATTVNGAMATQQLTIDTWTFVTITSPVDNATLEETKPTISGTAEVGATIDLQARKSGEVAFVKSLQVDNGNWSYTPEADLSAGVYEITAIASDEFGNEVAADGDPAIAVRTFTIAIPTGELPNLEIVNISGDAKYGSTLTATDITYSSVPEQTVMLKYQWKRGTEVISGANESTYTLVESDIGSAITVTVSADEVHATGDATSAPTSLVEKADGPAAPAAPIKESKTTTSITLVGASGQEYRIDGGPWQTSPIFNGLDSNKEYSFTTRVAETETTKASPASPETKITTVAVTETPVVTEPVRAGDNEIAGTSEADALITVKRGNDIIGTVTADENGLWTVALNEGITLSEGDVLSITAKAPTKAESQARVVNVLPILQQEINLVLTSNPTSLIGDGHSQATLTVELTDLDGLPIPNVDVQFAAGQGTLSAATVTTNSDGEATVTLTSSAIVGTEAVVEVVTATVDSPENGLFAQEQITIHYAPPVIQGQVLDAQGNPIANARVWVEIDGVTYEATTDEQGNYSITVPRGGDYTLHIEVTTTLNGTEITTIFTQQVRVQATGLAEVFKPERKVSGQLFVGAQNKIVRTMQEVLPENAQLVVQVLNDPENQVIATIDNEGNYELLGFEAGKTYEVVFNMELDGNRLAGKYTEITVGDDGQIVVQYELIDPYGLIIDAQTNELISGVEMKLYWADTALNVEKGRTPGELVPLPVLPGFPPNQNHNPQVSTGWLDDEDTAEIGNYAWMVFTQGDYYLIGEKDGYVTYDSRNDIVTDIEVGDSWIRDGIIHIGETIMRYDFEMEKNDEAQVEDTLRNLKIGYEAEHDTWESVTSNIYLIRLDSNETNVTWSSNHADVVQVTNGVPEVITDGHSGEEYEQITAEIHRQETERSVIVTATVSKGEVEKKRTFLLIVKASTVTKERDLEQARTITEGNLTLEVERINVTDANPNHRAESKIDKVILTDNLAKSSIQNQTATVTLSENPNNKADEFAIEIPRSSVRSIHEEGVDRLKIINNYVQLSILNEQLTMMKDNNLDLFFRIVPIKEATEKQQVKSRVPSTHGEKQVNSLGNPVKVETNYSDYKTSLVLPFVENGIDPATVALNHLRVWVEHTVGAPVMYEGVVVYDKEGNPFGLEIEITKFSIFTIVELEDPTPSGGGGSGTGGGGGGGAITPTPPQHVGHHEAYMRGFLDGTFRPGDDVTRAQVAAMLARNLGFDDSVKALHSPYPDVPASHWAANVIQFMKETGLIVGYGDGSFRPDAPITRAEMATVAARFKNLDIVAVSESSFSDSSNHWATSVIEANRNAGIVSGYIDNTFRPNNNLTRAEATKIINRLFDRGPLYGVTKPSWPDVPTTHWAYEEIEEASQDHYFILRPEGGEEISISSQGRPE